MGKWKHRLSNINPDNKRADCLFCGKNINIKRTYKKYGTLYACKVSRNQQKRTLNQKRKNNKRQRESWEYRKFFWRLDTSLLKCNKCEIQNIDMKFFDVNHKDGDHDNNHIDNLELLCPNCHRIETLRQWKDNEMSKWNRNSSIDKD